MRTVYVYGGWLHNGGAYMAFEAAACLANHLGAALCVIRVREEAGPSQNYRYSKTATAITVPEFLRRATKDDYLFLNPSFHKPLFSLSCDATIIAFIQHYTTFAYLDLGIKHFVANSRFVQDFLLRVYDVSAPLIQPFLPHTDFPPRRNFAGKDNRAILSPKGHGEATSALLNWLFEHQIDLSLTRPEFQARQEFLSTINDAKYLLTLVINEGFGLIPLEAMAMGSIPIGLNGYGGRDYLRFGDNCLCVEQRDLKQLPEIIKSLSSRDLDAISDAARSTAKQFDRSRFQEQWLEYFISQGFG